VVVPVHWEAGQEPLGHQHPQPQQRHQSQRLRTPEMHNTGCTEPSDLIAIL
jgi:hypothetical protein